MKKLDDWREIFGFESRGYPPVKLYGYKSVHCISLKIRRGGICYCCCCSADERKNRGYRKRNRKRARRQNKKEVVKQMGG